MRTWQKVNIKKYISGNKRMWAWIQWNSLRYTKRAGGRRPGTTVWNQKNRGGKQNKAVGEGLELVRGTKGGQLKDKGHRGAKHSKAAGEGLERCAQQQKTVEIQRTPLRIKIHLFVRAGLKRTVSPPFPRTKRHRNANWKPNNNDNKSLVRKWRNKQIVGQTHTDKT